MKYYKEFFSSLVSPWDSERKKGGSSGLRNKYSIKEGVGGCLEGRGWNPVATPIFTMVPWRLIYIHPFP
jgi:hypothetical protein